MCTEMISFVLLLIDINLETPLYMGRRRSRGYFSGDFGMFWSVVVAICIVLCCHTIGDILIAFVHICIRQFTQFRTLNLSIPSYPSCPQVTRGLRYGGMLRRVAQLVDG